MPDNWEIRNTITERRACAFAEDRKYRHVLKITWDDSLPCLVIVGLNPSTADEWNDDPTIRKCKGFARQLGFGGITMLNLFGYRSTSPKELLKIPNPVGDQNDGYMRMYLDGNLTAVGAWGTHGNSKLRALIAKRATEVIALSEVDFKCFGFTKDGQPKHLLYLPYTATPVPLT